jgi:Ca2+-dependent lipid-binding protein
MDPFVVVTLDGQQYRTLSHEGGGSKPVWNQTFEIPVNTLESEIKFTLFDEDFI